VKYLTLLLIFFGGLATEPLFAAPRPTAEALIKHFNMARVPQEGPWFVLTYSSPDVLARGALPERYDGSRAAGSAIIALITTTDFSAMHRLKTDEMWHYYGGDPLKMLILHPNGTSEVVVLGSDVLGGQKLQYVVPRGSWQGALPLGKGRESYSIIGDTLAPAFDYTDFEMGYRSELQQGYPGNATLIAQLTRKEFLTRPQPGAAATPATSPAASQVAPSPPMVVAVEQLKTVPASPGLDLAEVVGRVGTAHSERCSVAYFTLAAGSQTSTSLNKEAEEYFIVTEGTGTVSVGAREMTVAPGALVVIPPRAEHSLHAGSAGSLHFYAISAPAFSPDDYVVTSAAQHWQQRLQPAFSRTPPDGHSLEAESPRAYSLRQASGATSN
jgi:predicted cupin superfamily sugar epimerase/mannose-6-phosphate isomerase-like protein (cupin superfamily)